MSKQFILKNTVSGKYDVKEYLSPDYVFIPLVGHIEGIRQDDSILKGQSLNNKVYSYVSGKVKGIKDCQVINKTEKCLAIQNNFKEKKTKTTKKLKKNLLLDNFDENILNILNIETKNLVLNTVSDESRVFNNCALISEYYQEILNTMDILKEEFDYDNVFIIIRDTDRQNIDKFINIIASYPEIRLVTVPNVYPINNTSYIKELLNISDCSILKISDLYKIIYLFDHSYKYCEKYITINYLDKSYIVKTKLGTSIMELLNYLKLELSSYYTYYLNGLIGGIKVNSLDDLIVSDSLEAIYIANIKKHSPFKCINCGNCSHYCPVNIDPKYIMDNRNNIPKEYLDKCIKCGLCNYICPSYIDLKSIIEGSDNNENS